MYEGRWERSVKPLAVLSAKLPHVSKRDRNHLWGGRFAASPAEAFENLNASIPFDVRLAPYDIEGSIAHARMLGERGIVFGVESRVL